MAKEDLPSGHELGNELCKPCWVVVREPLDECPLCDGYLHRLGSEEVCDKCDKRRPLPSAA